MSALRRRDLLALAAAPLAGFGQPPAAPALEKPKQSPAPPREASKSPSLEELLGPDMPKGPVPPLTSGPYQGMRWQVRYQFDELGKRCQLQDFAMPTPPFGLATTLIEDESSGDVKARLLITRDGGKTWTQQKCEKNPQGIFVLDSVTAWYVANRKIYVTHDAGLKWEKLPAPSEGITQLWFASPETGFAFGFGKVFYRTGDGGRTWTAVLESESLGIKSPQTYLRSAAMLSSGTGMLVGDSTAVPPEGGTLPDWMTPDRALKRRDIPGTAIYYQTHDGGKSWNGQVSSAFGTVRRVRMGPSRAAVIFQYRESFPWPAELYVIDLRTGKSAPVLRRKELVIHDMLVFNDGSLLAAATQPAGRLRNSPVPGKLRILWSPDSAAWFEMKVDYRAVGNSATFSECANGTFWLATDEGAIVQLASAE